MGLTDGQGIIILHMEGRKEEGRRYLLTRLFSLLLCYCCMDMEFPRASGETNPGSQSVLGPIPFPGITKEAGITDDLGRPRLLSSRLRGPGTLFQGFLLFFSASTLSAKWRLRFTTAKSERFRSAELYK